MDLYVLGGGFLKTDIVETYESLIWTERYSDIGDFELVVPHSIKMKKLLAPEARLALTTSDRVMVVKEVEDLEDDDNNAFLKVSGKSLEDILNDRVAKEHYSGLQTDTKWLITATPGNAAREMFKRICVDCVLSPHDQIPLLVYPFNMYAADTNPEPSGVITWEMESPRELGLAIKEICDAYRLGFRLVHNPNANALYFNIYSGYDRVTSADKRITFSRKHGTLKTAKELDTIVTEKNVAYVFSNYGAVTVYAPGVSPLTSGFKRKAMVLQVTDLTDPAIPQATLEAELTRRGQIELTKHRRQNILDGEVNQYTPYVYGKDYMLGDIVELVKDDEKSIKYVSENILVSDKEGIRSYPTLSNIT